VISEVKISTAFVDAAGIYPDVAISILRSMPAAAHQFRIAFLPPCTIVAHVRKGHFLVAPSVG
jgi:hypothetical protein